MIQNAKIIGLLMKKIDKNSKIFAFKNLEPVNVWHFAENYGNIWLSSDVG